VEADKKQYIIDEVKKIPDSRSWSPFIMLTEHLSETEADVTLLLESAAKQTGEIEKLKNEIQELKNEVTKFSNNY